MANLKTDYKDDVLDTSKNEKRKYNLIQNEDGTVSLEDVTEYLQEGDSYGAVAINEQNTKINEINDSLNIKYDKDSDMIQILIDGTWTDWKQGGFLNLIPFNSGVFADGFSQFIPTLYYLSGTYGETNKVPNTKPKVVLGIADVTFTFYSIYLGSGSYQGWTFSSAFLDGIIDLSRFNYMDITCEKTSSKSTIHAILTTKTPSESDGATKITSLLNQTITSGTNTINISALNDNAYLGFGCNKQDDVSTVTLSVTKIRFYN